MTRPNGNIYEAEITAATAGLLETFACQLSAFGTEVTEVTVCLDNEEAAILAMDRPCYRNQYGGHGTG